nr:MAG TPA: hypothetical protein [Caudoviricetes sp.]
MQRITLYLKHPARGTRIDYTRLSGKNRYSMQDLKNTK